MQDAMIINFQFPEASEYVIDLVLTPKVLNMCGRSMAFDAQGLIMISVPTWRLLCSSFLGGRS